MQLGKNSIHPKQHRKRRRGRRNCASCDRNSHVFTLADVPAGFRAKVGGFCADLPADRLAYLQGYGLAPGYWVRVLQHSPVTVVQVEFTELALETELACEVQVDQMEK
jgi:hypothetical protein